MRAVRTLDRHVRGRRLPARLRRRCGWRNGLHRIWRRMPETNHRRKEGRRKGAAPDRIHEIVSLRYSPYADSTYQGIATVITLNSNQVWLSSAGCNTLYSYVQKAFHKYRYNYNTYILSLSPYAWLFVKGGLNINSGNLVTGIPNSPTLTVPALSQGVFDAGDYWVFWVTAYISSVSESLTPLEQLISANL
jgi:hypothetical protein